LIKISFVFNHLHLFDTFGASFVSGFDLSFFIIQAVWPFHFLRHSQSALCFTLPGPIIVISITNLSWRFFTRLLALAGYNIGVEENYSGVYAAEHNRQ
jgi:hypothetical protein